MPRFDEGHEFHNQQESRTDNRNATYTQVGAVFNAPVSVQAATDNSVTYEVDKEDLSTIDAISRFLNEKVGERKTIAAAISSMLLGALTAWGGTQLALTPLLFLGAVIMVAGATMGWAMQYKRSSRCPACQEFFAMQQVGSATVREVRAAEGIQRTVTRIFECAACSFQEPRRTHQTLEQVTDEE